MYTYEAVIIGVFLMSAFLVFWVRVRAMQAEQRTRFEASLPAKATIIEMKTLDYNKDDRQIPTALRFWVESPIGAPFKTRSIWLIEQDHIPAVRVGQSFPIRIDAITNRVIFPNVDWAKYDWEHAHMVAHVREDTRPIPQ
jgi:hypothetical protein